ncbi:hypothetical protein HC891_01705 [Candidatus Gracilibacteria bacterium]|nr:hypothetical protein [Candidatus Gracilibacteria bacterium]
MSFFRDPKRFLAVLISGVVGLIVLIDFADSTALVTPFARLLVEWAALVIAFALLVGLLSVVGSHSGRVRTRVEGWPYSVILLLAMLTVVVIGIFVPVDGGLQLPRNLAEQPIRTFFRFVYEPLAASLLALLAFFSLSAALRAVRRRSLEAIVLVLVAAIALALQLPQVALLPLVGDSIRWINDVVALAGARALIIGAAIGTLVAGVRVLLGFDMPYLDR